MILFQIFFHETLFNFVISITQLWNLKKNTKHLVILIFGLFHNKFLQKKIIVFFLII